MVPLRLQIDESFFLPEERNGYLVSAEMKRIWAVELDLLHAFAQVCDRYHLQWFAHAGTMLGAVRHHGFIPWDDDIDIVMPRKDYDRLCEIGPSVFSSPYFYQNESTDRFFCRTFSRLRNSDTTGIQISEREYRYPFNQGIFIDIFPYDNVSDNDEELRDDIRKMEALLNKRWYFRKLVYFYRPLKGRGPVRRLGYFVRHLWYKYVNKSAGDYQVLLYEYQRMLTAHNGEETKRVGEMLVHPLGRHIWNKEWFDGKIDMPFEMISIPVPIRYEECLAASFGKDWRIPRQVGNCHGQVFYDVDRPYTDYLNKP